MKNAGYVALFSFWLLRKYKPGDIDFCNTVFIIDSIGVMILFDIIISRGEDKPMGEPTDHCSSSWRC